MQTVIIAGGLGTRLRPLTFEVPKPMVLINSRPFVEHLVLMLKKQGMKDFVFCVGYLSEQFVSHFGDGRRFGVSIRYSVEDEPLGTGGALRKAKRWLDDSFITVYGDTYVPIDYRRLAAYHSKKGRMGTATIYDNSKHIAVNNMRLGKDGLIAAYDKKNPEGMEGLDAGVCVFNKSVLKFIPEGRKVSLEMEVFPQLIARHELAGFKTSKRFYDMGTPERLRETREKLK
ncbi:MAG: sugar phosphate nucleotidyltransferase [Candidatus Altiarchaeota archaeon]|nr:sugar phosphate nucleotidyltransferase [Candidatus Altiarchaeota archaeon]